MEKEEEGTWRIKLYLRRRGGGGGGGGGGERYIRHAPLPSHRIRNHASPPLPVQL